MKKRFLDKKDIMEFFDCGEASAYNIIRGIKSISDTTGLKGKVTPLDFELWLNRNKIGAQFQTDEKPDFKQQIVQLLGVLIKNELKHPNAQARSSEQGQLEGQIHLECLSNDSKTNILRNRYN